VINISIKSRLSIKVAMSQRTRTLLQPRAARPLVEYLQSDVYKGTNRGDIAEFLQKHGILDIEKGDEKREWMCFLPRPMNRNKGDTGC
jgi:hypothetical protein